MTGSSKERQERVDALLDVVSEKKRVPIAALTSLAVRSWLVNRKTAREYVDLLLEADWVALEGADYLITPAGRKHLLAVNDWPSEQEERVLTRSEKAKLAKQAAVDGEPVEIVYPGQRPAPSPPPQNEGDTRVEHERTTEA